MEQPPAFIEEPVSPLTSARVALENFLRLTDRETLTINRAQALALLDQMVIVDQTEVVYDPPYLQTHTYGMRMSARHENGTALVEIVRTGPNPDGPLIVASIESREAASLICDELNRSQLYQALLGTTSRAIHAAIDDLAMRAGFKAAWYKKGNDVEDEDGPCLDISSSILDGLYRAARLTEIDTQPKLNHQILSKAAQVVRVLSNRNNSMAMAGLCRTLDELAGKQLKKV